jgi:chaperonin GroES
MVSANRFLKKLPSRSRASGSTGIGVIMKFRPLHDRIALRRVEGDTKTPGGIIIPDTAAEKPQQGEIIAVGPGARGEDGKVVPLELKPKDKVLFGKWSGTEVKIDGQELLIMKESDVMGVLTN